MSTAEPTATMSMSKGTMKRSGLLDALKRTMRNIARKMFKICPYRV
jgi:hypothetical protein